MATEKVYSRVTEAEQMIRAICDKYPKVFWRVRPQMVQVWGVENKERPEGNKTLATVKAIKGVEKAIMQDANLPVRYHVTIFWSDWREWKENKRQGVLAHELLHIHEEAGKLIKHDIEDFGILVQQMGAKGDRYDNFPNMLLEDVVFDLSLLPKTEETEEDDRDEIDEDEVERKKKDRVKKNLGEVPKKENIDERASGKDGNDDTNIFK